MITDFHLSHQYDFRNGFCYSRTANIGIGRRPLDVEGTAHFHSVDPFMFDPSLTYGCVKKCPVSLFVPHYVLCDRLRLTFRAFFKQSVPQSPLEHYRIRQVNIIYFVEDDTITVMEPEVANSGLQQRRLVRRNRIPKTTPGDFWHWKDFNIGIDVTVYGVVYHIVDCDSFTREYLHSQGIVMNDPEEIPPDPYTSLTQLKIKPHSHETKVADDKFKRFLEYDGKVLRFFAVYEDPDSKGRELRPHIIYYYLADDTVEVQDYYRKNNGRDPFPLLLRKMKLPKDWKALSVDFPSVAMEVLERKATSYYTAKDFLVGEIIFILGRRFLIYDADEFTRKYFKEILNITQKDAIDVSKKMPPPLVAPVPPYFGFGSPEDSLQSSLTVTTLKPPKKNVVQYVVNIGKHLRYEAVMDWVHPEDKDRKFMFSYSLSDCSITITEIPQHNSGFVQRTYLRSTRIPKPGTNWDDPQYYSPDDFAIGKFTTLIQWADALNQ
ncbi:EF-hand domain-containing protein 1 isoform X3 [Cryptotermes secundus]|uniref:EF-hand domain-containing protein 1 isoform X3 n=1 Tax=Cryptotermes secundus TaxID=105785 RepID=UPI001454B9D1|nr:EF-hand domain-containing protein 1 isoform X3 [Cryptotermes secundus]